MLDTHCQLQTDAFPISNLSCHRLRNLEYEEVTSVTNFELEHAALSMDKSADMAITLTMKGNSGNISELLKRNEEMRVQMEADKTASLERWENVTGGEYPMKQIILRVTISLVGAGLIFTLSWITKLQIVFWKSNKGGRVMDEVNMAKQRETVKDIKAEMTNRPEGEQEDGYMAVFE